MLRMSSSTDLSTSGAQIMVEYDGVDAAGGGGGKSIKKSSKVKKSAKSKKNLKGLKNLQRPSVRRNVYQSTDPLLIQGYEELDLPSARARRKIFEPRIFKSFIGCASISSIS